MRKLLINLKKRLYIYVLADFILALLAGYLTDFSALNIKPISILAVFVMLYPMLTGMAVEKVKKAGRNFRLIGTTLLFAYGVASVTAYFISRTILIDYPDIAFAMVMVGAIPCSNMLIGWSGIADASVEDALVIAVAGLLLIPVVSPVILWFSGGVFVSFDPTVLASLLLLYILVPLAFGMLTRKAIIKRKGMEYFMDVKKLFPGISAIGILLIVFFSVAKVSRAVLKRPEMFLWIFLALILYYLIQTGLSFITAKLMKFRYEQGMILILGATASSQAISLSIAATLFGPLTVFALSFKPILQVLYIMALIYGAGPKIKKFLN